MRNVSASVSGESEPLLPLVRSNTSTVGASSPSSGVDPWDKWELSPLWSSSLLKNKNKEFIT